MESLPDDSTETTKNEEEIYCGEHFVRSYKSNKTERFIVQLPIRENAETLLGYSKENAVKRLNEAPVKTYKVTTVTYGAVSAPFLATMTLRASSDAERVKFPNAADVICNDSSMDDILSGESTY
ncbi:DUF1758 domain-containing protein [Trichonephila clavipes]|nr:DUF1758 domain-containing protein [Trichonephila clavipes]